MWYNAGETSRSPYEPDRHLSTYCPHWSGRSASVPARAWPINGNPPSRQRSPLSGAFSLSVRIKVQPSWRLTRHSAMPLGWRKPGKRAHMHLLQDSLGPTGTLTQAHLQATVAPLQKASALNLRELDSYLPTGAGQAYCPPTHSTCSCLGKELSVKPYWEPVSSSYIGATGRSGARSRACTSHAEGLSALLFNRSLLLQTGHAEVTKECLLLPVSGSLMVFELMNSPFQRRFAGGGGWGFLEGTGRVQPPRAGRGRMRQRGRERGHAGLVRAGVCAR